MDRPSAPLEKGRRRGALPPMPHPGELHRLLDEVDGNTGYALWRVLTDVVLWAECGTDVGSELFWFSGMVVTTDNPDLAPALSALGSIYERGRSIDRSVLAGAAADIWFWAERRELRHTALLFSELAARLEPDSPDRASTAGRLCRPIGDPVRGTRWYLRAARLARLVGRDADFAIAHLGWGNMEAELGRLGQAEFHATKAYRAALRVGRHSLAASAYHDLMTIKIHTDQLEAAWQHGRTAAALYRVDHPRFPALAHDIAFLWGKLEMFSSALPVYLAVLPTMTRRKERLVVLANIARSAAASHERLYYQRASKEIMEALTTGYDVPVTACYHLARGSQTYEDWGQAELLAVRARDTAQGRWLPMAEDLVRSIQTRESGDRDVLPPEGGEIDQLRELLLRRLKKHGAAVGEHLDDVPPERYPIT